MTIELGAYEINEDDHFLLTESLEAYIRLMFGSITNPGSHVTVVSRLTGEPFCGCMDCEIRETVAFLVPRVADLLTANALRLQHSDL